MEYPPKEIVAIIALTILGVVFANFGVSERILWGIVVGIAGIAGFKLGYDVRESREVVRGKEFPYYWRQLLSTIFYLTGSFLLIEHLWSQGSSWDWWVFPPGHEMYGLIAIIIGILVGLRSEK